VYREQTLAPDAAFTHRDRGYLLAVADNDQPGALAQYKQAHALAPNDASTMNFLANGLAAMGQWPPAVGLLRKAIATDPLRAGFYANLASVLLADRQLDAAEQALHKTLMLQPGYPVAYTLLATVDILRGDAAAAQRDALQETDPLYGPWIKVMVQQIGPDKKQADAALRDYLAKNSKDQPYLIADMYALRKQPDQMFDWLQRAWTQSDPSINLLTDPFVLAYQHDPRFAGLCKTAGLPLPQQTTATANSDTGTDQPQAR
jgi:tetratricopeptide (TPR) repeat protein